MGSAFAQNLELASTALSALEPAEWDVDRLLAALKGVAEAQGFKLGDVMQPVRVALTGSTVSEPVNELLAVVGREPSLRRLHDVARRWSGGVSAA
jgi:glutamyl-tRNA synthetase